MWTETLAKIDYLTEQRDLLRQQVESQARRIAELEDRLQRSPLVPVQFTAPGDDTAWPVLYLPRVPAAGERVDLTDYTAHPVEPQTEYRVLRVVHCYCPGTGTYSAEVAVTPVTDGDH